MTTARAAALNGGTRREPAAKSVQNPCTCSALVLRADSGFDLVMSDEQLPDPNTPEWSVAWAAREVLRRHLGPRYDRNLPSFLAKAVMERMRLSGWLLTKKPPNPPHSTYGPPLDRK
ncbi:MAG: hypothetical protein ACRDFW_10940 [bacterium]